MRPVKVQRFGSSTGSERAPVDEARVEVDVGVQLALDKVVVGERVLLQSHCHLHALHRVRARRRPRKVNGCEQRRSVLAALVGAKVVHLGSEVKSDGGARNWFLDLDRAKIARDTKALVSASLLFQILRQKVRPGCLHKFCDLAYPRR